jgi:TolB-like protein
MMSPRPYSPLAIALLAGLLNAGAVRAQCPNGSPPPCAARPTASARPTIAVLYFDNLSSDTSDAYLAHGMTEELIARLGQLSRLSVKSRSAVLPFRNKATDPATMGRALGATHLVSGSVRRAGQRVRVSVELVQTSNGVRLWGQQFDNTDTDMLAIQDDVASGVAQAIAGQLGAGERASLQARPTRNAAAYDYFLRANYSLAARGRTDVGRAILAYEEAARLDPTFAQALARAAYAHGLTINWGWVHTERDIDSVLTRAFALVDRATKLDSTSSDVWMTRGLLLSHRNPRSLDGVQHAFDRALALDRVNAEAYHMQAWLLWLEEKDSLSLASYHRALAIDSTRAITHAQLARHYYVLRRYADARRTSERAIALDPTLGDAHNWLARSLFMLGDTTGARAAALRAEEIGSVDGTATARAVIDAMAGDTASARARIEPYIRARTASGDPSRYAAGNAAGVLVLLGDHDRALQLLERAPNAGRALWEVMRRPEFDAIRDTPRFRALERRLKS